MADKKEDNVEVKSEKSRDPQLVLTLGTKDGTPFDAKIEVDLVVLNVDNERVVGHAHTQDYIREAEAIIPINFNDRLKDWKRVCGMPGARLGYRATIHLMYEDGIKSAITINKHLIPTFDPPITMDGVQNQFENDKPQDKSGAGQPITAGTDLLKGEKYPCPNGIFYLSFQEDGNLVIKAIDGEHFWWGSHNYAHAPLHGEHAKVHEDGNLHIYGADEQLLWATDAVGGFALTINTEGLPVILNQEGETVWEGAGGMNDFHREIA